MVEVRETKHNAISAVALDRNDVKITVRNVPDQPGIAANLLSPFADQDILIDLIVQNTSRDGLTDFTFTVQKKDKAGTLALLEPIAKDMGAESVECLDSIVKISLIGIGMRNHSGVASRAFSLLAENSINIQLISTSEIKITVVVDEKYAELATRVLHAGFDL